MLFRQIIHEDLGCASYLVGDVGAGVAAVVDPQWDIEPYLRLSRLHGVRDRARARDPQPRRPRLRPRPPRPRHRRDDPRPRAGRGRVPARGLRRRLDAAPGRRSRSRRCTRRATGPSTPPSCCATAAAAPSPGAVLTGDSLFVGDVARPDLAVEPRGGRGARSTAPCTSASSPSRTASRSGPGTSAARSAAAPASTTRPPRRSASSASTTAPCASPPIDDFVADAVGSLGDRPPNVEHVVALNRGPLIEELGTPTPLTPARGRGRDRRGRDARRRPHQRAVRRGPHPRRDQRLRLRHRLRAPRSPASSPPTSS